MSAKRLLDLNGDSRDSPLLGAVRRLHAACSERGIPYCVIGGMAVIRNGAPRTTMDIDILTLHAPWGNSLPFTGAIVATAPDACVDTATGITIDVLFSGDDWHMPLELPDPGTVSEFDDGLGAFFISLHALVQLKMSVYLGKLREDGLSVAAKDLADVMELMKHNYGSFSDEIIGAYDSRVRNECLGVFGDVGRMLRKGRDSRPRGR